MPNWKDDYCDVRPRYLFRSDQCIGYHFLTLGCGYGVSCPPNVQCTAFAYKSSDLNPDSSQSSYPPLFNIGCGEDLSIRELAEMIADTVGYSGKLVFDSTKPDGTMRKLMDVSRINSLGWHPKVALEEGVMLAYRSYTA